MKQDGLTLFDVSVSVSMICGGSAGVYFSLLLPADLGAYVFMFGLMFMALGAMVLLVMLKIRMPTKEQVIAVLKKRNMATDKSAILLAWVIGFIAMFVLSLLWIVLTPVVYGVIDFTLTQSLPAQARQCINILGTSLFWSPIIMFWSLIIWVYISSTRRIDEYQPLSF